MDSWRTADEPACPACGEPLDPAVMDCPHCGEQFLSEEEAAALTEHLAEALETEPQAAPRWAVLLTGLALGIAIAPLVTYAGVIATGVRSLGVVVTLLLAGWLLPGIYLARFRNPSEVLSRGLYLVVAGIGAVVVAVGYDTVAAGESTVSQGTALLLALLAVPAVVAAMLARRASNRAARQLRGEPGRLHERAGVEPDDEE
ncbi:zinc ribbon domain-containing protein [Haloarcula halophila]|uniref:zinc ribbon domain-containing protein n=1 Tax=Haloarcula TaxID=2237 RepID=UPI0023E43750|nr:zinc ribbon domain-containing protein [Halomicroarcula sp. DFY41]